MIRVIYTLWVQQGKRGSTSVASLETVAKQKGITAIIHNHPYGTSDGRKWGGTFSEADLGYIMDVYNESGGKVNKIIATSREGTYTATIKNSITQRQITRTYRKADKVVIGKKFQSEKAMWSAAHSSLAKEFGKIGIEIKFDSQPFKKSRLVTQKIGTYDV